MKYGKIIAICGLDGVGKTTQINILKDKLQKEGIECEIFLMKIGFTSWVHAFRMKFRSFLKKPIIEDNKKYQIKQKNLAKNKKNKLMVELYRVISTLDLIRQLIFVRLASRKNVVIICDRYIWDNYIIHNGKYPHINLEKSILWKIVMIAAKQPAISLLLNLPSEKAIQRILNRSKGKFDENLSTLKILKQKYDGFDHQAGWQIVDASPSSEKVSEKIWIKVKFSLGI